MTPLRQRMLGELRLRNYADNTVERYLDAVKSFARYFDRSPDRLGREQIRDYLLPLVKERNAAPNTVQIHRAALRFLYVKTLGQQWFDEQVGGTTLLTDDQRRAVDRKGPFCKTGTLRLIGRMPPGEMIPAAIAPAADTL